MRKLVNIQMRDERPGKVLCANHQTYTATVIYHWWTGIFPLQIAMSKFPEIPFICPNCGAWLTLISPIEASNQIGNSDDI